MVLCGLFKMWIVGLLLLVFVMANPCAKMKTYEAASTRGAEHASMKQWASASMCFSTALRYSERTSEKVEALCNIAACQGAQGKHDDALKALKEAIRTDPKHARPHSDMGRLLATNDKYLDDALSYYKRALELSPSDTQSADELANLYFQLSRPFDAVDIYKKAVTSSPKYAKGYQQIALIYRESKMYEESARNYKAAIMLEPRNANFRYSYGNMLYDSGDASSARNQFAEAVKLNPTFADAYNNKGNAERSLGMLEEAFSSFKKGLEINPTGTMFLLNMGQVFQEMHRLEDTIDVASRALQLDPNVAEAYLLLGSVAYTQDRLQDAVPHYRLATKLNPTLATAYVSLANTLGDIYRKGEATLIGDPSAKELSKLRKVHKDCIKAYKSLLSIDKNNVNADAFSNLMWARKYVCDWGEWDVEVEALIKTIQSEVAAGKPPSLKPFLALSFPVPPELYLEMTKLHSADELRKSLLVAKAEKIKLPLPLPKLGKDKRLSVGYMSTDFQDHPVGHQAWFHLHTNKNFKIILFSLGRDDGSDWRKLIAGRAGGNFYDFAGLNAAQLAVKVNALNIQILITLNGWTSGHQLGTLGLRPSPLQIEYMGAHDTTGARFIDLFISDVVATPPEFSQFYSEKIAFLPDSFFMNEYRDSRAHIIDASEKSSEIYRRENYNLPPSPAFIFCNFNQLFKVDPESFSLWMKILSLVPDSVLWLLRLPFGAEENLRRNAEKSGVDPKRLIFSNRGNWTTHLHVKALANLSLDNPQFNSHTSGVDILWAGVPLLTIATERMSGRVGASLVRASLSGAVTTARTMEDYLNIALSLSSPSGHKKLLAERRRLEEGRRTASLFDTEKIVEKLERALLIAWEAKTSSEKQMHVAVAKPNPK